MPARHRAVATGPRRLAVGLAVAALACVPASTDRTAPRTTSHPVAAPSTAHQHGGQTPRPTPAGELARAYPLMVATRGSAEPRVDQPTAPTPTQSPTPRRSPATDPKDTPAPKPKAPPRRPAGERVVTTAYLTGYSSYDNTPPGSARIAYPGIHDVAAGTGSYDDPVTLAVGWHREEGPQWPAGSRFYLPFLHKYVVVEDQCGDDAENGPCYQLDEAGDGATTWLDVWVGGEGSSQSAADDCMSRITAIHTVVHQPAETYPVNRGDITSACEDNQFWSEDVPAAR